ncbi:TELO2-interacting protein 1 homolog isoform X1 [Alosa pseudoharengus]|uniref:TELO2-interacting protein 1 homolog isoform X1 n=1 Tax=Alosa pseudoharengus TaxID=34774 RepID=UPI003F89AD10
MALIDSPKVAFAFLRPSCVILTREPTVANVEVLNNCLHTISDGALQQLQDYVLFPLRFVLKIPGPKQEGLVLAVMDTMHYVLEKTSVRNWESLYSIFSELCLCISCPNDPGKPGSASEELKLSVLKCLDVLLHAAYGDVVFKLYEPSMLPTLGAAISLILALIEEERAREVQIAALNCLQALAFQCDCYQDHVIPNQDESYALGNALASFLPGLTQTLSQVICHNVARGHTVVMRALRVLYKMLSVVMDDDQLLNKETVKVAPIHHEKLSELAIERSSDWTKITSQRLSVVLQKIISCTSAHQHWRVRLELVSLSEYLLTKCSTSLGECTGSLIGALVGAVNDDDASVREKSSRVLKYLSSQATRCHAFTDILSENLHVLSSSLPQLMSTSDDHHKFFVLNMFLGYMKVLGSQVEVMLNSAVHLKRISKALMHVLEMDMTDVRMVEERSFPILVQDGSETHNSHILKTHFLYFTDDKIYLVLREICQMLGYYGNLNLLVDHFMDLYRESSAYRKQSILVLNEVLAGAAGFDMESDQKPRPAVSHLDLKSVISPVIEEYISTDNWHLPTSYEHSFHLDQENHGQAHLLAISKNLNEDSMAPVGDVKHLNSNIWQICLQLEGIGIFSKVIGLNFHPLLMMVLYSVLEKVGDKSSLVSQSAVCTMSDICQACGYVSTSELINSNADYLLNDISLNLGRPSFQPHAPRVFAAMVTHSDDTLLPLVMDVVQDVLTSLDLNHDQRASEVCEVLHSVMKAIVTLGFSSKKQPNSLETKSKDLLDARKFLLDYSRQVKLAEGIIISQKDQDDQEISSVAEDHAESIDSDGVSMDTVLPPHITIAKDVMERCIHLLSMSSSRLRLKVLHILKLCVHVMCEFKDHLFPIVHRCWPVLQQRLNDEDPFIIPQAFKLLCTMGEVCTDFLKKRASKTVIPKIAAYLTKQAQTSAKAGPNYTQSLNYKLQLAYLQGLGPLCVSLDLDESDVDMVSEACLPYLSDQQPPKLQEACCSVFQCLINKDPDVIWFTLCEQFCPYIYQPLHRDLMPVKLCGMGQPENEYTHNIGKLLKD